MPATTARGAPRRVGHIKGRCVYAQSAQCTQPRVKSFTHFESPQGKPKIMSLERSQPTNQIPCPQTWCAVIQQLKALCTGQDFVVDSAILLSSLWLSSFQLFQMPLAMIARLAPRGIRGGRTAVLQILRLLVTLLLARHTKTVAVKYRLHSTLGSLNLYGRFVTEYLREKINPNSVLTNGAQAESGAGGEGCADNNDTG